MGGFANILQQQGGPLGPRDPRDADLDLGQGLGGLGGTPGTPAAGASPPPMGPGNPMDIWNNWLKTMGPYLAQQPTGTPDFSGFPQIQSPMQQPMQPSGPDFGMAGGGGMPEPRRPGFQGIMLT